MQNQKPGEDDADPSGAGAGGKAIEEVGRPTRGLKIENKQQNNNEKKGK